MNIPFGTRFRATYQRTVKTGEDGVQTHSIFYPTSLGFDLLGTFAGSESVGYVISGPGEPVYAWDAEGMTFLGDHADIDQAIIAVIEHDQAKHNHRED